MIPLTLQLRDGQSVHVASSYLKNQCTDDFLYRTIERAQAWPWRISLSCWRGAWDLLLRDLNVKINSSSLTKGRDRSIHSSAPSEGTFQSSQKRGHSRLSPKCLRYGEEMIRRIWVPLAPVDWSAASRVSGRWAMALA